MYHTPSRERGSCRIRITSKDHVKGPADCLPANLCPDHQQKQPGPLGNDVEMEDRDVLILDDMESMSDPEDFLGQDIERLIDDMVRWDDQLATYLPATLQHPRQGLQVPIMSW